MPWNDTAQLDYTKAEVRQAVIETILHVARMFPIIRFDAAMTPRQAPLPASLVPAARNRRSDPIAPPITRDDARRVRSEDPRRVLAQSRRYRRAAPPDALLLSKPSG